MSIEERVLIHAPVGRDGQLAQRVLAEAGVEAVLPADMRELCAMLDAGAGAVLLTEETLTPSGMALLLGALARQPTWSDVPLIVFGAPSSTLLEQSANMTVIERPVRIRTLVSATKAALRARRRQYETRNLVHKLEQSVRDRDQFLAMLGHELRNPLAAILTASELMDRRAGQPLREQAIVSRQSRHLARLVDDLLEVARVTSGKIVLHRVAFDLHEVAQRALATLQPAARQQGVELGLHSDSAPLLLVADPVRVEQVLTNIVGNGIKYTPSGGRIDVEVLRDGDDAVLRVRDTGAGIDPAVLPRIFDLFVQGPDTMDRAQGGMGIGLTLVQRLVLLHGGSVRAQSDGPGKGSEFEVRLPLHADRGRRRRARAGRTGLAPHRAPGGGQRRFPRGDADRARAHGASGDRRRRRQRRGPFRAVGEARRDDRGPGTARQERFRGRARGARGAGQGRSAGGADRVRPARRPRTGARRGISTSSSPSPPSWTPSAAP